MRLQIEPSDKIVSIDGVTCRAWNGVNEKGVTCIVLVHLIMVDKDADAADFDFELIEKHPHVVQGAAMRQDWG